MHVNNILFYMMEYGDRSRQSFEVVSTDSFTVDQAAKEQYKTLQNAKKQITLITCGGVYDASARHYDQRIIVRAKSLP